jgi:hypothetical protein
VPEGSPALRVPEHRFTQSASHATPFICRRNRRAHAGWPWHRWSDVHGTSGRTAFRASHPPLCRCLAGLVVLANDGGTAAADGNGTGGIGGEPTGRLWPMGHHPATEANRYRHPPWYFRSAAVFPTTRLPECACPICHLEVPLGFRVELWNVQLHLGIA